MNKPLYIFFGLLIGITLSISGVLYAQIKIFPEQKLTKADYFYNATRTPEILNTLSEAEILLTKEKYNNTQELKQVLIDILAKLSKIERNTR